MRRRVTVLIAMIQKKLKHNDANNDNKNDDADDDNDEPTGNAAPSRMKQPEGLALLVTRGSSALCVSDKGAHCVRFYDVGSLQPLGAVGRKGSGDGELCNPSGLAVLPAEVEGGAGEDADGTGGAGRTDGRAGCMG